MIWAISLALVFAMGCGPTYPNCETDKHCAKQNEVCVNQLCKQCRDDSQCNSSDPCGSCAGNSCTRRQGCCVTDADCPGQKCWIEAGQASGSCGPECGPGHPCPAGHGCAPPGKCIAGWECGPGTPCPDGKRCTADNKCVACSIEAVYFDFNESRIRVNQREKLDTASQCIKAVGSAVRVEGHSDERGTEEYNMALGERRSTNSKKYLVTLGVSGSNLRTMSYGEERPTCTENNEECWGKNRRAEFIFE